MSDSIATVIPSATNALVRESGWLLRPASTGDRAALQHLLKTVSFGGSLALTEDRGGVPGRLRAFEAQGTPHDPLDFILEDDKGLPIGCFSIVVRGARFGADTLSVGHISDLRITPAYREAKVLPSALSAACDNARDILGAEVFFTGCFDYDHRAYGALTQRDERRYQQPMAQVMHQMTLGMLPLSQRASANKNRRVERGSNATLEEVGEFLSRCHAMSTLGHVQSAPGFAARLHQATGGDLERIILVREDRGGALACCGAVLSTGSMRKFTLEGTSGEASSAARRFNMQSWTGGYPQLPTSKGPQEMLQLGFVAQKDDDPGPLRDLILTALTAPGEDQVQWLTVAIPRHGNTSHALDNLRCFKVPLSLMAVTRAGTRWNNVDFRTQRCGIEHIFL